MIISPVPYTNEVNGIFWSSGSGNAAYMWSEPVFARVTNKEMQLEGFERLLEEEIIQREADSIRWVLA